MAKKIYLVEDERSLNILLEKYLQREGYDVTTFSDGNSAIEKIKDKPDLWILDIMLPGVDGYELIERLYGAVSNETEEKNLILGEYRISKCSWSS